MAKGIFHSELVRDTNAKGGVVFEVASEPKKSKYQGKPDYIFIKYNGEERALSKEHDDYFDDLILRKGDQIRVKATGSRDSAKLVVTESGELVSGGSNESSNGDATSDAELPQAYITTTSNGAPDLDALGVKLYAALGKSDDLVTQFFSDAQREAWSAYEAADVVLRVANTLFIQGYK